MPKEVFAEAHSHAAHSHDLAVEWHDDKPVQVPITHFDFTNLDSMEDEVLEAIKQGRLRGFLETFARLWFETERAEIAGLVLNQVAGSNNPRQTSVEIGIAVGAPFALHKTYEEWAQLFGVTKEAIQQGAERFVAKWKTRKNRAMRDPGARQRMRARNYRRTIGKESV